MPLTHRQQYKWSIVIAIALMLVVQNLDFSAVNLAITPIAKTFHTAISKAQWVLSVYFLAWGTFVITAGRLADLYGRRKLFLLGSTLFTFSSLTAAFAPSIWMLIISRFFQGLGSAAMAPAGRTLIYEAIPVKRAGLGVGIISTAVGLGLAFGPSLGGVIFEFLSWRWLFVINLPIGLFVITIIYFSVKNPSPIKSHMTFDYWGMLFLSVGIFGITFFINEIQYSFNFGLIILLFFSLTCLFYFIRRQLQSNSPLINLNIFQNRFFVTSALLRMLLNIVFSITFFTIALFLQNVLNYSSLKAGQIFLAATLALSISSPLSGHLIDLMGGKKPALMGALFLLTASFLIAQLAITSHAWQIIIPLILLGLGMAFTNTATMDLILRNIPEKNMNANYSISTMLSMFASSLGIIFSTLIMIKAAYRKIIELILSQNISLNNEQILQIQNMVKQSHFSAVNLKVFPVNLQALIQSDFRIALKYAFDINMYVCVTAALLSLIIVLKFSRQ